MPYGTRPYQYRGAGHSADPSSPVRLGKSGLKVSRLILGCMTYGTPEWQGWVLGEEEAFTHIKAAFDAGINAFDTANVRLA
jgi:aryl-alcohol dehydrogenase-like predicted oxidoreductase